MVHNGAKRGREKSGKRGGEVRTEKRGRKFLAGKDYKATRERVVIVIAQHVQEKA